MYLKINTWIETGNDIIISFQDLDIGGHRTPRDKKDKRDKKDNGDTKEKRDCTGMGDVRSTFIFLYGPFC